MKDGVVIFTTFTSMVVAFWLDSNDVCSLALLGVAASCILALTLWTATPRTRAYACLAIGIATCGEFLASIWLGAYIYSRDGMIPLYVPVGHGMVMTAILALARLPVLQPGHWVRRLIWACAFVGTTAAAFVAGDHVGLFVFLWMPVVMFCDPKRTVEVEGDLLVGTLLVTTFLEYVGTYFGCWRWVPIDPVLRWPQGNPPSGVAGFYTIFVYLSTWAVPMLEKYF